MKDPEYDMLRNYVMAVTGKMIQRGVIRRGRGESIEDVLRAEAPAVLAAVRDHLAQLAAELGMGLAMSASQLLGTLAQDTINKVVTDGANAIAEAIRSGRRR